MPLNLGNAQEVVATKISLIQGNAVTDILSIIADGAGVGTVTSATAPLAINSSGVLTIDLAAYATSSAVNSLLANYTLTSALFAGVSVGAGLVSVANAGTLSLGLTGAESRASLKLVDSGGTVRQLTSTTGGVLAWEAAPVALTTDLANKIDALTVSAPLAISGSGTSRALSLLWKPSTVTAGSGLAAVANDAAGTLALTLDGTESRALLKLVDSGGTVRNLAASLTGALVWNASQLVDINDLTSYSTTAQTAALLAAYSTTAQTAVLLAAKQATISATTDLTTQDLTCRFLTGGSASVSFTISSGSAMTLFKDVSNNTLLTLENAVVTIPRPLTCEQTATFRQAITLANTAASLSGQLYVTSGNKLAWQGQEVVDVPTLNTKLAAFTTYTGPFTVLANASTGVVVVGWNAAYQHDQFKFTQTTKILRCTISNGVDYLTWGPDFLATIPVVNAGLASQNTILSAAINARQLILTAGSGITLSGATISAPAPSTIANLVSTTSGISLGSGNWPNSVRLHRLACYEAANSNHFYGVGLHSHNSTGLGLWTSTGANVPYSDSTNSGGIAPHLFIMAGGNVGIGTLSPGSRLHVNGSFQATSKSFVIEHPAKEGWKLRHWCVETGDAPGGALWYRRRVTAPAAGALFITMPSWFGPLAKNVMIFCNPFRHHGTAWGEQDEEDPCTLTVHCSRGGAYNVLITADRNDHCATHDCPQEVEFREAEPAGPHEP